PQPSPRLGPNPLAVHALRSHNNFSNTRLHAAPTPENRVSSTRLSDRFQPQELALTHPMTPSRTAPRPTTHRAAIIASAILLAAQTTLAQTPTTPAPTPAATAPSIKLTTLAPSIPDNLSDEV
ncbi:MAG: hypothetical protein ACK51T_02595, partial [bacterium]